MNKVNKEAFNYTEPVETTESEAVARTFSVKKVFLEISQNSQKNI